MRLTRRLTLLLAVACGVSVANVYYAQSLLGRIGAGLHVGANDEIFPATGAHPYRRDLPNAESAILDTGHFALEDHADVIAGHLSRFTDRLR